VAEIICVVTLVELVANGQALERIAPLSSSCRLALLLAIKDDSRITINLLDVNVLDCELCIQYRFESLKKSVLRKCSVGIDKWANVYRTVENWPRVA